jgi:ligand-binding SRPBCC domain-containing protein
MAESYRFETSQVVPRPRAELFAFFADAHNLERITPDFLRFRIETKGPIELRAGALIDYSLRLYGVPIRWRTRIEQFDPPRGFVDVQLHGPYRRWIHRHEFESVASGTQMRDCVDYELPYGLLGRWAHGFFVRRSLRAIFAHRARVIAELFPAQPASPLRSR